MILHLSAPAGQSINDSISKEDFLLQYVKVDDAIRMVCSWAEGHCEGLVPPHNYTDMRTITVTTQLSTRAT